MASFTGKYKKILNFEFDTVMIPDRSLFLSQYRIIESEF